MTQLFHYRNAFRLESGETLPGFHLAYTTHGQLNAARNNVVWIFHALTANSDPQEWWPGLVGKNKVIDPAQYFIICVNKPGSPYGSISPLSTDPQTGTPYGFRFPVFTIRDMVHTYQLLREALDIQEIVLGIGGSTGGMQLLEWAIEEPGLFRHIVPIATNAVLSPWGIAFNASQRMAIEADSTWRDTTAEAGQKGMAVARSIALLSYRHYRGYGITQGRDKAFVPLQENTQYAADNYQRYQGLKLVNRFDARCYYRLTQSMDSHDTGRGRGSIATALQQIKARTLVIGITSDLLYPVEEQEFLQATIPGASLLRIASNYGHDGFLLENETIEKALKEFIQQPQASYLKIVNS